VSRKLAPRDELSTVASPPCARAASRTIASPSPAPGFDRAATARSKPGAGLGLAIVREAATAHGGTATAENAAHGARFRLTLPVAV